MIQSNGVEFDSFFFSGGEPHVKIKEHPNLNASQFITARINSWNDFGELCAYLNALEGVPAIHLYLPYFPGGRQDRTDGTCPLTVDMYAAILYAVNSAGIDGDLFLYTFDIHSQEALSTIGDHAPVINLSVQSLDVSKMDADIDTIVAPDKGAVDRALMFRSAFFPDAGVICFEKERDFNTGRILSYKQKENPIYSIGEKTLVVDDICDGGATFNLLADAIGETDLQLYVSHGIFSKGVENLSPKYSKIYTTPSFPVPDNPRIVEIPLPDPFEEDEECLMSMHYIH